MPFCEFKANSHPSIFIIRLSEAGSRWQLAKQGPPGFFLPSYAQFLLGDPEAFPGPKRYVVSPAGSGSAPGSPPSSQPHEIKMSPLAQVQVYMCHLL